MTMTLHRSWHDVLGEELQKPYIGQLKEFLQKEREEGQVIYPPSHLVFNAFSKTPYEKVKVVIMGQDPYHGEGQAMGLSFSVPKGVPIPPSLKNIYKELESDLGIAPASHGCLEGWAEQGVLLLNATLTVRQGQPKSHYGRGWEVFTDSVVRVLCDRREPLIFMLWGRSAQEKCGNILDRYPHSHVILKSAHPSPFSATNFFGCRHFSQANEVLRRWGQEPIDWRVV